MLWVCEIACALTNRCFQGNETDIKAEKLLDSEPFHLQSFACNGTII